MSKEEFQKLHEEMHSLKSLGKADEFASKFLSPDAIFISPVHDPVGVKEVVQILNSGLLTALENVNCKIQVDEVIHSGDIAVDRSTVIFQAMGEEKVSWVLTAWVRVDGAWKIRQSSTTFKSPLAK